MQKNVPKYTPDWVATITLWAESSKRDVSYALCNDRRTLLWFANQRAVEYHPTLMRTDHLDRVTHLVLDLDPPAGAGFDVVVKVAHSSARRSPISASGEPSRRAAPRACTSSSRSTWRRRRSRRPLQRHAHRRPCRAARSQRSPRRRSSRTTAAARSSSTRLGSAGRPSSPPTAHGPGPACRCRSRCRGRTSTASSRRRFTIDSARSPRRHRPVGGADARSRSS